MAFCTCSSTLNNTGKTSKQTSVAAGKVLYAVQLKADDGTVNEIPSDVDFTQEYLDAKINETDETKRWFPIGTFVNNEDTRGDVITESFSDGSTAITQNGVRTYLGLLKSYAPVYVGRLKGFACTDFGIYTVDQCGDWVGSLSSTGTLRPIKVNKESWNPQYIKATDTVKAKVQLGFEFDQIELDEDLRVIEAADISADVKNAEGLLPLSAAISSTSTTGFVAALTIEYDKFLDSGKEIVPSWVIGDFILTNKTTNSVITITSVTESPEGTYTFVIPAQSASDVLELTNDRSSSGKRGFFLEEEITIP